MHKLQNSPVEFCSLCMPGTLSALQSWRLDTDLAPVQLAEALHRADARIDEGCDSEADD